MHIDKLQIRNFRNFLRSQFEFQKGVNTLIGENGSGKTNALYALRLLLDDSLYRNATHLRESDFCRALGDWHGHWIIVSLDFAELDPSEGCQLLKQNSGHMNETNTGTYTFYFRPKQEVRRDLHEMATGGSHPDKIRGYLTGLSVDDYEPILTGRATADFLDNTVYANIVGDFKALAFPDPESDDQALLGVRMGPIHPEISCTFAQALRDVVSDLRRYRSNPLLTLLRGAGSSIQIEDATRISQAIKQLNLDISSLPEIQGIATGVQATLHSTVGHTYSPSVSVESALPAEIERLLQRLTITVGDDPSATYRGDLREQSLGGANLIYLALKLLEYEVKLSGDRAAHFLLIEEPEAHIHTHIQKTLFENQAAHKTQVIVSTHSTHVSSAAKIRSVNILARQGDHADVFQPAAGLSSEEVARVERYLDAVRSTLLFAKGVILVEGDAELVAVSALVRRCFGISVDELGVSVVAMDSAFFVPIAAVFHPDRVRRRCAIITDLDNPLVDLPECPDDDDKEQSHARASQKAGELRHNALEDFTQGNPWVQTFYAQHTFEVDFLVAKNCEIAIGTLASIYVNPRHRELAETRLRSADLAESGTEILRLANKVGKGWFGLLLSELLEPRAFIPDYILRALAFAVANVAPDAIKGMGLYRIKSESVVLSQGARLPDLDDLKHRATTEFIRLYLKLAPNDDLARFVNYLRIVKCHANDHSE